MNKAYIKLTSDCEKTDENYLVTIERPDGIKLKILIPREDSDSWANEGITRDETFGLNMVTDGHYCQETK